ncbi:MAG: cupin domain-containing protein [Ignavibacteriaceae bacterium]
MNEKAKYYIDKLMMNKHPEGGYYNEIYRAGEIFEADVLPGRYSGSRVFSTSIYFLLSGQDVSTFHRLQSDEIWHFYDGCSVKIYIIDENEKVEKRILGTDLENGEVLQTVLPKNCWFGAELNDKSSFALIGCTVSPGFDFEDFELGDRGKLLKQYPQFKELIIRLTKA